MAFGGGLFVPLARLGVVLRHALAAVIEQARLLMAPASPSGGGLFEPFARLGVILRHALAVLVEHGRDRSWRWRRCRRRLLVPLARLDVVLPHTLAVVVRNPVWSWRSHPLQRGLFEPFAPLVVILRSPGRFHREITLDAPPGSPRAKAYRTFSRLLVHSRGGRHAPAVFIESLAGAIRHWIAPGESLLIPFLALA